MKVAIPDLFSAAVSTAVMDMDVDFMVMVVMDILMVLMVMALEML